MYSASVLPECHPWKWERVRPPVSHFYWGVWRPSVSQLWGSWFSEGDMKSPGSSKGHSWRVEVEYTEKHSLTACSALLLTSAEGERARISSVGCWRTKPSPDTLHSTCACNRNCFILKHFQIVAVFPGLFLEHFCHFQSTSKGVYAYLLVPWSVSKAFEVYQMLPLSTPM